VRTFGLRREGWEAAAVSSPIQVTHVHGESVSVAGGGVELLRYVYRPDPDPFESRKPYAHPLRTLAGRVVTGYRPHDHRWHKGLQMTASHVSDPEQHRNFWGGNSYLHGQGYLALPERIGSMRHDAFDRLEALPDRFELRERLTWVAGDDPYGAAPAWAEERRGLTLHSVEPEEGAWVLDWSIRLRNVHHAPLRFGSPTTAGRPQAGYTGLHWRGPRDLTGGDVFGPEGLAGDGSGTAGGSGSAGERSAAELMGRQSSWLAFTGPRDEADEPSMLIFVHAPENAAAIHPSHWFVRSEPTPTVAFSWAFREEFELPPGASFDYRYRVVVADGGWDRDRVERYLKAHPWEEPED
jgi:hypothetical protein